LKVEEAQKLKGVRDHGFTDIIRHVRAYSVEGCGGRLVCRGQQIIHYEGTRVLHTGAGALYTGNRETVKVILISQ
jgi:hypothetical protein